MFRNITKNLAVVCGLLWSSCVGDEAKGEWIELFNGKDLTGWTPKFTGEELGVNYKDTYRVKDGLLQIRYDKWDHAFNAKYGHLFFKDTFKNYRLIAEYRFVGEQVQGGPGWAWRNNGIMIHGQKAEELKKNQEFPNSIEVQILGAKEGETRTTGNLCTPGTQVVIDGKVHKPHVVNSKSKTFAGDQWVTLEVEVKDGHIKHFINGELVMEYDGPQLDDGTPLTEGSISVQAESAPCDFRRIAIKPLP